jgi:hypothetical protein
VNSRARFARLGISYALVWALACDKPQAQDSDRSARAETETSARAASPVPLRCLAVAGDKARSCMAYEGPSWAKQRAALEAQCLKLGDATFGEGTCPERPAWGRCVHQLSDKSKLTTFVYRRPPPAQPGDVESEDEARRLACGPDATWLPGTAASASASPSSNVPSASTPNDAPPRARPTLAGICEATGELRPAAIRLARVDLHDYARWAATLFNQNVLAAGEAGDPEGDTCAGPCLTLDLSAANLESALTAVGAHTTKRGNAFIVGPELKGPPPSLLALASPRVDLDFSRVASTELVKLLSDVGKFQIRGMPEGALSLRVANQPASEVVSWMAEVAGTRASAAAGALVIAEGGQWPPSRATARLERGGPERSAPGDEHPFAEYRVAAVGLSPTGQGWALLSWTGSDGPMWSVKVGAAFGAKREVFDASGVGRSVHREIKKIDCDGVEADDGTRLQLR